MSNITAGTPLPAWVDQSYFYLPFHLESLLKTEKSSKVQGIRGSTIGFGVDVTCRELSPSGGSDNIQFEPNQNGSIIEFSTSHLYPNGTRVTCVEGSSDKIQYPAQITRESYDFQNRTGPLALEVASSPNFSLDTDTSALSNNEICASSLAIGWVRVGDEESGRTVKSSFMSCTPTLHIAPFEVVIDTDGRVLNSTQTGGFADDTNSYFIGNSSHINSTAITLLTSKDLLRQSTFVTASYGPSTFQWHNDSFTSDWNNVLLGMILNSSALVDPSAPLPNMTAMIPIVEDLYQTLFSILLGLNSHVFAAAEEPIDPGAEIMLLESRLFVSSTMFVLSITILSLHFIVAILYYCNRPRRFLPRMPTSIASIMAYVSASRVVQDFGKPGGGEGNDHRYGYGRYIGTDGKTHVGIERQRYVVPLKSKNPEVRRRRWGLGEKGDEREPRTWI